MKTFFKNFWSDCQRFWFVTLNMADPINRDLFMSIIIALIFAVMCGIFLFKLK